MQHPRDTLGSPGLHAPMRQLRQALAGYCHASGLSASDVLSMLAQEAGVAETVGDHTPIRCGDEVQCARCGKAWGLDDDDVPGCLPRA